MASDELWQEATPYFDRALEMSEAEQAELLDSLRRENPELARFVGEMLEDHRQLSDEGFLELNPTPQFPELQRAGLAVGPYKLVSPIGEGGMGRVWLAERSDGRFERRVAVKFLHLAFAGSNGVARFRWEGRILGRLAHPHIAELVDAGVSESGQPYLVIEHVDGESIDCYCDRHMLDVKSRIRLFLDVLAAVGHAHSHLIVHRDIKPSNVLVRADGQVKLLDFGIAKLLEAEGRPEAITKLTREAGGLMTPLYAAPEQLTGDPITTATDVYALGVLLYVLLAGQHPAGVGPGQSAASLVKAIVETEPPRMSEAAGCASPAHQKFRRTLKGELDTIVGKALKKDPQERYGTVERFAEDLARHLRNEPVTARPDSLLYRAQKFAVRHRGGVAAALFALTALVAGTGIAVWQARESARERDRALTELRRAEATNDFSSYLLSEATPARGKPISNAELLAKGESLIGKRFTRDPALRVHMLLTLADRYEDNQQYEEHGKVLKLAYDDSRSIADAALRTYATCQWAGHLSEKGGFKEAFALLDAVLPRLGTEEGTRFDSRCLVIDSVASNRARDFDRAIRSAERALRIEERRGGSPERALDALTALYNAHGGAFRYQEASRFSERASALMEAEGRGDSRDMAELLQNRSVLLQNAGQMREAAVAAERAIRVAQTVDGEHGPSLTMLQTYGVALMALGRHGEADRMFDEAITKTRAVGSPERVIGVLITAAESAGDAGDLKRAERLLGEANAALTPSASQYSKGRIHLTGSRIALEKGEHERALELAMRAQSVLGPVGVPLQILFARALNANGRPSDALPLAQEAVDLWRSRLGGFRHSFWLARALTELASAKAALGDVDGARQAAASAFENALAIAGPESSATKRADALRRRLGVR